MAKKTDPPDESTANAVVFTQLAAAATTKTAAGWTPEMLKQLRSLMLRRVMPESVIEEADTPNLPDSQRAIIKMIENRNVWETVNGCKTPEEMHRLLWRCTYAYSWLDTIVRGPHTEKLKKHDYTDEEVHMLTHLMERELSFISGFGRDMFALGIIRGMQLGRELDTKTQGNVDLLLKHPAIRKLLLQDDPKASNLTICRALDKVERVPSSKGVWSAINKKYGKEYGTWERAVGHQSVRTLITLARRAAVQEATFQEFLTVASGVGDEGSITNKFRPKKYANLVKSKK